MRADFPPASDLRDTLGPPAASLATERATAGLGRVIEQFSDYLHAVATPEELKLQEYVEELVERPPLDSALEVDRAGNEAAAQALRARRDSSPTRASDEEDPR